MFSHYANILLCPSLRYLNASTRIFSSDGDHPFLSSVYTDAFSPIKGEVLPFPWMRLALELALTWRRLRGKLWGFWVKALTEPMASASTRSMLFATEKAQYPETTVLWGNQASSGERPHGRNAIQPGPSSSAFPAKTSNVIEEVISSRMFLPQQTPQGATPRKLAWIAKQE